MNDKPGMEVLLGKDGRLTIDQCMAVAIEFALEGKECTFALCGPDGSMQAKWLDPHLGTFRVEGNDGFLMVAQFRFTDAWCESVISVDN